MITLTCCIDPFRIGQAEVSLAPTLNNVSQQYRIDRAVISLPRHRQAQALLGRDKVIEVVQSNIQLNPRNLAVEDTGFRGVILSDRQCAFVADIRGLIRGENHRE